ncbi:MAG TPA: VTT domain-containing protein [Geobacteraceae bacterium]
MGMKSDCENHDLSGLRGVLAATVSGCTDCGLCVRECAFLKKHGSPKTIADSVLEGGASSLTRSFECNLCGLCTAVCPKDIAPDALFLEMRREAVDQGFGNYPEHKPLLNYERLGTSRRFTLYRLPAGCTSVFFPGCALSGTRPEAVQKVFNALRGIDPGIGIVFDCCMKPSQSLGRREHADAMLAEMGDYLKSWGIKEVLVACPNCQVMFGAFAGIISVRSVYEALAEAGFQSGCVSGTVTVHDPCVIRNAEPVQRAVRNLLGQSGVIVEEMPHSGKTTICCGLGGGVRLLAPELADDSVARRKKEAGGRRIVTYCAGCVQALAPHTPASHLLDILFSPEAAMAGKKRGATAPFTYLNRLRLKRRFKRMEGFAVTRERTFVHEQDPNRKRSLKPLIILVLLAAAFSAVHFSGAGEYLRQEKLRELIASYGMLAPAVYMLIYAIAPVLFLPGLPITIAGGILFGPFWGVVYTITGSTIGASLAFLTARYLARDWVKGKLTGPRWEKLDSEVARHGWKVVAFTRLIPAFPFNLLNYAFGLTNIPFSHYALATFICMLPACIAFIVFSSSLLGLIRGSVSPTALVGIALIVLVSLIPVIYRRFKGRQAAEATE